MEWFHQTDWALHLIAFDALAQHCQSKERQYAISHRSTPFVAIVGICAGYEMRAER